MAERGGKGRRRPPATAAVLGNQCACGVNEKAVDREGDLRFALGEDLQGAFVVWPVGSPGTELEFAL